MQISFGVKFITLKFIKTQTHEKNNTLRKFLCKPHGGTSRANRVKKQKYGKISMLKDKNKIMFCFF